MDLVSPKKSLESIQNGFFPKIIEKLGSITKQRRKPKFYFLLHPRNYSSFYIDRIQKKINLFIRFYTN